MATIMAREVMTLRLDRALRRRLRAAAGRRGATPSAAARVALEGWLQAEEGEAQARPFEALADLIGTVGRGNPRRSSRGARRTATRSRGSRGSR
jgi:hypothetical protein